MTDEISRQISGSMDGELDEAEAAALAERLASDPDLKARFYRFHVAREAARGGLPPRLTPGFADSVRRALDQEPPILAPSTSRPKRSGARAGPMAGAAIAASVAVLAIVGLRAVVFSPSEDRPGGLAPQQSPPVAQDTISREAAEPFPVSAVGDTERADARRHRRREIDAQLSRYLVRHNELASPAGRSGFVRYVHLVSSRPDDGDEAGYRQASYERGD